MEDPLAFRALKRAENLRNSNGQIIKELADGREGSTPSGASTNGFALGASFKRTFRSFRTRSDRVRRSKSLSVRGGVKMEAEGAERIRWSGHSRSLTDVSTIVKGSADSPRMPVARRKRLSVLPHVQNQRDVQNDGVSEPQLLMSSDVVAGPSSSAVGDVIVPQLLQLGTPMTKVSLKKHKRVVFRLDADLGQIEWESKRHKIIPIENIKEIRSGDDSRHTREQFQVSQSYHDRWLTIVYLLDGNYKSLHLIAATKDVFWMWDRTLRDLHAIRLELMRGLGNVEIRQALWEKQYWKNANEDRDQKLIFVEVENLCRRLNINSNYEDLLRLFNQADTQKRQFLDFNDFRRFVKLLKARPEIDRLYKKLLRSANDETFNFGVFDKFMKEKQASPLSSSKLLSLFDKYSSSPTSPQNFGDRASSSSVPLTACMTLEGFTSFLLSPDNSVFADQHRETWQDMTRPLSEYFISSSHNTYLVGHQLVGISTVEGYIRALLHSCRSVEVDIYDGEQEPMIFHGKTFTSKVSLREVCQTISKYGFVASPYPIIISAEIHCGLAGQDMIAEIMIKEFGDSLVRLTVDPDGVVTSVVGMSPGLGQKIEQLPSPEELKGKILLKTKNLSLMKSESAVDSDREERGSSDAVFSDSTDSEALLDAKRSLMQRRLSSRAEEDRRGRRRPSDSLVKEQLTKARTTLLKHVGRVSQSTSIPTPESVLSIPRPEPRSISLSPSQAQMPITPPRSAMGLVSSPTGITSPISPSIPSLTPAKPALSHSTPPRCVSDVSSDNPRPKHKMSFALVALLVYTVGVKFRGINKKEEYAPEHMFSLSENTANRMLKVGMWDFIKHTKTHLVRTYPKGTRVSSTNYEPHRFWAAGMQLVAINWQTFDLGYMINHAMFQRNGRSGYVLKPEAIRLAQKERLVKRTMHSFDVTVISAQQLPRPKNALGHEVPERAIVDPYVEMTLYVPDWPLVLDGKMKDKGKGRGRSVDRSNGDRTPSIALPEAADGSSSMPSHTLSSRTSAVKKNGWNPVWEEKLRIPFDCVGDMMDLIFVRFVVRQEEKVADEPLAVYCASLGSLQHGYRHLPLHDSQLSQYLFSTLFVKINISLINPP